MVQKYKDYLEIRIRRSPQTTRAYICRIKVLLEHLTIKQLNKENIEKFLTEYTKNKSRSTLNGYINAINSFLKFLEKDFKVGKQISVKQHRTNYFKEKDFKGRIIPIVEYHFKNTLKIKTIFYVMFYTGARISDITNLQRQSIDLDQNCITFKNGKGGVDRTVPFIEDVKELLIKYFESEPQITNAFNIYGSSLSNYCYKISKLLGDLKFSPHSFRHSFARWYLDDFGGTLDKLQYILGHKDIKTTQEYTKIRSQDLIDGYKRQEKEWKKRQKEV